ncbi:GNAT family N-acetyltransferase [Microbacterium sp. ZW T6_19]|uniref:GNAT family N-acetyltransferase n=1 Tax=Microbacterium sp. ZW T6_19 TaxID=3378082 RepID=UPI00385241AF
MRELATPTLLGEQVTLREYRDDDRQLVLSVVHDPLIPLMTTVPQTACTTEVQAYIERQRRRASNGDGFQFVVVENALGRAVGQVGITFREQNHERASVGYWIAPQFRGHRYAAGALRTLADWALHSLTVERLELYVEPWNEASCRTAESAGFEREGLLRRWERVGSERRDMYMYSLVRQ